MIFRVSVIALLSLTGFAMNAVAETPDLIETPSLFDAVAAGDIPAVAQRVPEEPSIAAMNGPGRTIGLHGGTMRMLMGRAKDTRMMVVYGYARLVGYGKDFNLKADILAGYEAEEGRIFTLRLRKGHRWSDGHPFTSEDFRYYWEDVVNNKEISPGGAPRVMRVDGEPPEFEVIDEVTVRYTWAKPNPFFLPSLAAANPLYIYRPAHYLKRFHARYTEPGELEKMVKEEKQRNWVALNFRKGRQYKNNNPDLPTLQPWALATRPPSERFVFKRNPYYHRIDAEGRQLPYIDQVVLNIANSKLIPLKSGAGEADLQARGLQFNNYTFLKRGEKRGGYRVRLWKTAKGSQLALHPNLNVTDPVWRGLVRKADFRRALSLAIDRHEINTAIYFGLATEANNTVLPESPLYKKTYATKWAGFDVARANQLLDGLGLTRRDDRGVRLLPDGRTMDIIVETSGEETEQTDVLELIRDSWLKVGIRLFTKPLQREVLRNRVFAGTTLMSVWFGMENGVPTPDMSPGELAPTSQHQLQWPKWGQHFETNGKSGETVDLKEANDLFRLYNEWRGASTRRQKEDIWRRMLEITSDQVFTIGVISGVLQPVLVNERLRNVPEEGIYNWDPGAHFGIHRPDTFWFAEGQGNK
ncbi:MAG: ABC transporter substrate-binding protein [Rhodospirillales bacterium]